jgi:hypothetical protein
MRARKYVSLGEQIAKQPAGQSGGGKSVFEEALNTATFGLSGSIGEGVEAAESAEEFLQRLGETLLDFRALGNLAAQAFAWFIKLVAKAIWDYVVAPLVHWSERAVSFYWINFFGSGTEQGSGFGYQLRNNAGAITILFWAMGYAILWSDGTSAAPVALHESLLGQAVKGVDGYVARRNLIKPSKVKEKTPPKPKPKESSVVIERENTFSVSRKRPVTVQSEGVTSDGSDRGGFKPSPVPRPTKKQKILLPGEVQQAQKSVPA